MKIHFRMISLILAMIMLSSVFLFSCQKDEESVSDFYSEKVFEADHRQSMVKKTGSISKTDTVVSAVLSRSHDYNGDGRRNIGDVTAQLNHLTDENSYIAPGMQIDINNDTLFDIADVTAFLNMLAQNNAEVQAIIDEMTLYEKVCQLFIVAPESITGVGTQTAAGNATKNAMKKYPVGGMIFFAYNLKNRTQTTTMLQNMTKYSVEITGLPTFLCVDEEGGRVARIANNAAFGVDNVGPMAEIKTEEEAYEAGSYIGSYLKELGFNVDFAPDADVITNPKNTVIGNRSFGTDPETVSRLAIALSNGLHNGGVLSTMKHFPGHGGTEGDTHAGYAYSSKTKEELLEAELLPFIAAANKGVDFVMVAHIALPNVTGNEIPCTLSRDVITGILREELNYQGLIVTDALGMGAITKQYSSEEAAVQAFLAGNDMLLMPEDFESALQGMLQAVEDGVITEARIDESLERIIAAKLALMEE